MDKKIHKLIDIISSKWLYFSTIVIFIGETCWLAVTSRFPMAYDESYHFGLIKFFSHRLNPIVTNQSASSYRFGALIQNPSFLYHYLMSFPYRLIELFFKSSEAQVIGLRLINIALVLAAILIIRRLLRLLNFSNALANLIVLAFALTPIVTVLSAQISYDNLIIPLVALSVYWTLLFVRHLDQKLFNVKLLLSLLCLCLFSSLVKFAFLPIFLSITLILLWKIGIFWRQDSTLLKDSAKKGFMKIGGYARFLLLTIFLLGGLLFIRFYAVNVVKYHNPVPQCNQVLTIQDCKYSYAWNNNYILKNQGMHVDNLWLSTLRYSSGWVLVSIVDLYGAILPLQGPYYVNPVLFLIVALIGTFILACVVVNSKRVFRKNTEMTILGIISLIYIIFLWGWNYHDYLQIGQAAGINGRYLVPVLILLYTLLGFGLRSALKPQNQYTTAIKVSLATIIIFSFVCLGGFSQYVYRISPIYGHIGHNNDFSEINSVNSVLVLNNQEKQVHISRHS